MSTERTRETRDGYGEGLVRLAHAHTDVVALDCDLGRSTRAHRITEADAARFFDMGIAEQDMISTAAGMAKMGKTVFVNSFAVFVTGRSFDQIRQQVALPRANVKVCGSSAGITQGPDGATHQSVVDVALMRSLPNMTVIVPADARQAEQAVAAAYERKGPAYLRLSRYPTPDFVPPERNFRIGEAQVLREGDDVCLCGCGPVLCNALAAADLLEADGIRAGVVNFHTLKPLDAEAVARLAGRTGGSSLSRNTAYTAASGAPWRKSSPGGVRELACCPSASRIPSASRARRTNCWPSTDSTPRESRRR